MGVHRNCFFAFAVALCIWVVAGDVTLEDLRGPYQLHAGNVDACTESFNITSSGSVIKSSQLVFSGKQCTSGGIRFALTSKGDDSWLPQDESKAGPVLRGELGTGMICGGRRFTNAHLIRPRANTELLIPNGAAGLIVNYDAEVKYFTIWSKDGGCVFRSAAAGAKQPTRPAVKPSMSPSPSPDAEPCISTAWLRDQGLEHAAIRHAGVANVLCITGLPCASPGHLLRECAGENGRCQLVTYREVCEKRGGCIKSATAVSQLNHKFAWDSFRTDSKSTSLQLTSLSAHPFSSPMSPSRLLANTGDYLNRLGMGWICNEVARLSAHFYRFSRYDFPGQFEFVLHGAKLL